jgi:gamma-polyglutamate biosynthesis protein CapC
MFFDIFPLPLFPQGSLSSSIITTVWVGVFVIAYFNLRLGWVLSGLVVPGYLVPLLILNPWSVAVIILESIVTYFIVWLFSEYLSRWGPWCNFFGRDRFLAIVLASVLVRIIFDAWLLPMIGEFVVNRYHLQFDYQNHLHSFGLIIIALIANQFWKTGLVRGLFPLFTALGITYLIVRFGLMELTNFSLSNLSYVYEDLAVSILSAPKAYIILVVTAFVASRMNLHYSWDFNGILIPALLALQWYQPYKILTSFLEAFIILLIAHLLLASPLFKSVTMEGARKLLLFFNISFIYKIGLGYFLLWYMPTVKITDYYAFGYLLSTLIAIKMYDKHIAIRMTRIILQISLTGVALASVLGFAMTLMPSFWSPSFSAQTQSLAQIESLPETELMSLIHEDRISLYQGRIPNSFEEPIPGEIESFQNGLKTLLLYRQTREQALLEEAAKHFAQVHYQTLLIEQRYVYLREMPPRRNWGIYVLDLETDKHLLVEVPAPLDEWGTMEVGAILFTQMSGHALAIAGSGRGSNQNGVSDMLLNYHSFFQIFHQLLAQQNAVQIRAYTSKSKRILSETLQNQKQSSLNSSLWVKRALPTGLNLSQLEQWIGHYEIEWTTPSLANAQRTISYSGFSELFLNQENLLKILFRQINETAFSTQIYDQRIDGYLQDWLLTGKGQIAAKGTNLYTPPNREELLFFDIELLTPLLKLIRAEYQNGQWRESGLIQLRLLASEAAKLGYAIKRYRQRDTEHDYLILEEQTEEKRYWGTYIFRLEVGNNYMIQVPRPLYEMNSFEYAVALFERLQAKVLLIGGTHPLTNVDSSADLLKYSNRHNLFNLVNQVVLRELATDPLLVIHSRAFGANDEGLMPTADILLAFDKGLSSQQGLTDLGKHLYESLKADELTIDFVHGQASTIGYEVGNLPQALYLPATQNKEFVLLWLSPTVRQYYRQQTEHNLQGLQFKALNIPTISDKTALYPYLLSKTLGESQAISSNFRARLKQYIQEQDMLLLQSLLTHWPQYRLERFIDVNSRQAFLLIYDKKGKLSLVANLFPRDIDKHYRLSKHPDEHRTIVTRFIETRMGWLEF